MNELKKWIDNNQEKIEKKLPPLIISNVFVYSISVVVFKKTNIESLAMCANTTGIRQTHTYTHHLVGAVPFLYMINRLIFRQCPQTSFMIPVCTQIFELASHYLDQYKIFKN